MVYTLPIVSCGGEDSAVCEHGGALQEPLLRQVEALREGRRLRHVILGAALEGDITLAVRRIKDRYLRANYRVDPNI